MSRPDDALERDAEMTARRVMSSPTRPGDGWADRHATSRVAGPRGEPATLLHPTLGALAPGQPLPPTERGFFEQRLGRSFAGVRLHGDAQAARLAASIDARAFTLGEHVFLARGERAGAAASRPLLAHELAHVVQQRDGGGDGTTIRRSTAEPAEESAAPADESAEPAGAPSALVGDFNFWVSTVENATAAFQHFDGDAPEVDIGRLLDGDILWLRLDNATGIDTGALTWELPGELVREQDIARGVQLRVNAPMAAGDELRPGQLAVTDPHGARLVVRFSFSPRTAPDIREPAVVSNEQAQAALDEALKLRRELRRTERSGLDKAGRKLEAADWETERKDFEQREEALESEAERLAAADTCGDTVRQAISEELARGIAVVERALAVLRARDTSKRYLLELLADYVNLSPGDPDFDADLARVTDVLTLAANGMSAAAAGDFTCAPACDSAYHGAYAQGGSRQGAVTLCPLLYQGLSVVDPERIGELAAQVGGSTYVKRYLLVHEYVHLAGISGGGTERYLVTVGSTDWSRLGKTEALSQADSYAVLAMQLFLSHL